MKGAPIAGSLFSSAVGAHATAIYKSASDNVLKVKSVRLPNLLPWWKIKREWRRLLLQADQWHWVLFGAARRRRHDRDRDQRIILTEGDCPPSPDVAVLLIFQPGGVLASTLAELDHFLAKGFAPVVVSNTLLAAHDLELLRGRCHLILQRPNYGYDFGGYRDGILTLLDRHTPIRNLVVKNDSIWFPLSADCNLLDRARASEADLFGIFLNDAKHLHIQSYFYHFGPRILASPFFEEYWRGLVVSDNKHMVVHRCEMLLTKAFSAKGFSVEPVYQIADVRAAMKSLDDAALETLLRYYVQVETRSVPYLQALIGQSAADPAWRERVEALIDSSRFGKYFMITHPLVLFGKLHCPVLKKDRQPMYQLQRAELFRAGLADAFPDVVRSEIAGWDAPPTETGRT